MTRSQHRTPTITTIITCTLEKIHSAGNHLWSNSTAPRQRFKILCAGSSTFCT
ncbi:unnamed protein product [Staurois parvus]|uniref:Uncharacterized protein n=1 Tax=Staurois parvus TaxID=386267 RepID=A0ABN9CMW9_9NEOB|nr:unnamed protein product [Staurois parvus]